MTPFVIRCATLEDAAAVAELSWMLWDYHHTLAPDRVLSADEVMAADPEQESPNDKKHFALVAEVEAKILGYAKLIMRDVPRSRAYPARSVMMLQSIAVRPEARRSGIGRALVEAARARARDHGAGTLQIPVLGFNTEALAFYRSLGFEDEFLLISIKP